MISYQVRIRASGVKPKLGTVRDNGTWTNAGVRDWAAGRRWKCRKGSHGVMGQFGMRVIWSTMSTQDDKLE